MWYSHTLYITSAQILSISSVVLIKLCLVFCSIIFKGGFAQGFCLHSDLEGLVKETTAFGEKAQ